MTDKPHKGRIEDWFEIAVSDKGNVIFGRAVGHPDFDGEDIRTSFVVKRDGDEIETRNSRYTLGRHASEAPQ